MISQLRVTSEQRLICECLDRLQLVEANAGAAKTTSAAMKIKCLLGRGSDPRKVLALAFTEPAVIAYRNAFARVEIAPEAARAVPVGTFDDFCAARLKRFEGMEVVRLTRPEQVRPYVLDAIAKARAWADERFPGEFSIAGEGELAVEALLDAFSHLKGTMSLAREGHPFQLSPDTAGELGQEFTALAVFKFYEADRTHFVDADGARTRFRYAGDATYDLARELVSEDPPFAWDAHPLRLNLDAVILDEMHDVNLAMFTVLRELLRYNDSALFLGVGDRDQVIHSRTGADAIFMGEAFDREMGRPTRMLLSRSYRFGPQVAVPLGRFSGKPYLAAEGIGSSVEIRRAGSAKEVLALVNDAIGRRHLLRPGSSAADVAVLLRNPSDSVALEHELRHGGRPYVVRGFTSYLVRPEILFVRAVLMAAVDLKEQLSGNVLVSAKRALCEFTGGTLQLPGNVSDPTPEYVNSTTLSNFADNLRKLVISTRDRSMLRGFEEAARLASSDRIQDIRPALRALDLKKLARRVFVTEKAVSDAVASIRGFVHAAEDGLAFRVYGSTSTFLKSLIGHDYDAVNARISRDRVVLASIESVKGLEFDHVIVPDFGSAGLGASVDNKNLFYVAASRARQVLTLTCRPGESTHFIKPFAGGISAH